MIIYNKLGDYLKSKDMKYIDLQRELQLSPSMTAKFTKNRTMSTDTINKVCEYLQVQPSEIMEWIPDAEYNKANEQIANIDAQIAQLMAKKKELQTPQSTHGGKLLGAILLLDKNMHLSYIVCRKETTQCTILTFTKMKREMSL